MSLDLDNTEFEYHTQAAEQFIIDFDRYVAVSQPLFALEDELIYLMNQQKKPFFKIPAYKTKDGRDHTFYFKLAPVPENPRVKAYIYLGIDLELKNQR